MGKNPAFLFYPNDWLRDTAMLSPEAKGAWINCLAKMHFEPDRGKLSGSYSELGRLFGCGESKAEQIVQELIKNKVCNFEKIPDRQKMSGDCQDDVRLISRRMQREEILKISNRKYKARQRDIKMSCDCPAEVMIPLPVPKDPVPVPVPKNKESKKKEKKKTIAQSDKKTSLSHCSSENNFFLPEWINPKIWDDYLGMRCKIKRPATEKAKDLVIKKLSKLKADGEDPNAIIEQSIMNSWQGIFHLKKDAREHKKTKGRVLHIDFPRAF